MAEDDLDVAGKLTARGRRGCWRYALTRQQIDVAGGDQQFAGTEQGLIRKRRCRVCLVLPCVAKKEEERDGRRVLNPVTCTHFGEITPSSLHILDFDTNYP